VKGWLCLDKRSLAFFRICLGLILLLDIVLRSLHFRAHYTREGLFPLQSYLIQPDLTQRRWSVFFMNDSPLFVGLLLMFFFLCALSLTVGYRTRLVGWLCWVLLLGVYRRNPVVNNAGDIYLPLLLLWGNFLPWGEYFSLDGEDAGGEDDYSYSSFPGFCYLAQVAILYWFSAVLRTGEEWQVDGQALYYALNLEPLSTRFAPIMLQCGTEVLSVITFVTLLLEVLGPVLLFLPSSWARILGVVLIMSFHFGIVISLLIPVFAAVCMVAPLGLLPALVWENRYGQWLSRRLTEWVTRLRDRLPASLLAWGRWEPPSLVRRLYFSIPYLFMALTLFFLYWGIRSPDERSPLTGTLRALSLDQRWGMFSPRPPDSIGWESVPARTESGKFVNLIGREAYSSEPLDIQNSFYLWAYRWRAFHLSLTTRRESHTQLYLRYLVKEWDRRHPSDPIVAAEYIYHPRTIPKRYLLGEKGSDVIAVFHR